MRLNKSTRYALYAAMEMSSRGRDEPVTAGEVADRYGIPSAVQSKVFQQLVHGGIAIGFRGSRGGYRLARRPSEVTVLEVIDAMDPNRALDGDLPSDERVDNGSRRGNERRLQELIAEVDELARCTFASITLETLVGTRRRGAGASGS